MYTHNSIVHKKLDNNRRTNKVLVILLVISFLTVVSPKTRKKRIVEGEPAALGEIPWYVRLHDRWDLNEPLCGGSIISENRVLTAAHCTDTKKEIRLVFGTITIDKNVVDEIEMYATEFFIHPDYEERNLTYDVSLIKLPRPLIFSKNIQAIKLVRPSDSTTSFIGEIANIVGHGCTNDTELVHSKILLKGRVIIISWEECVAAYDRTNITLSTLCAKGFEGNQSICNLDSGGPLTIERNGEQFQIGINSFVCDNDCIDGHPSAYANVTTSFDFIQSHTGLNLTDTQGNGSETIRDEKPTNFTDSVHTVSTKLNHQKFSLTDLIKYFFHIICFSVLVKTCVFLIRRLLRIPLAKMILFHPLFLLLMLSGVTLVMFFYYIS